MVRPYYEEDGITIYHGDCREILPQIEIAADIVLTSPPYNVGLSYLSYDDDIPQEEFIEFNRHWLGLVRAKSTETARLYAIVGDKMLWWFRDLAIEQKWKFGQLLTWCKPNIASGRINGDWNYLAEWILLFRSAKRLPMLKGITNQANTHNWFVIPSPQSNWSEEGKQHIAQWPIELPLRLLARTPGEIVLDPFCGSGSGLIATKRLFRRAIGIEIEERYCEIATKRLAQQVFALNA